MGAAPSLNVKRGDGIYQSLPPYQGLELHGEELPDYRNLPETPELVEQREGRSRGNIPPTKISLDDYVDFLPVGHFFLKAFPIC